MWRQGLPDPATCSASTTTASTPASSPTSPPASVRRPMVSDESQAVGLTADELGLLVIGLLLRCGTALAAVAGAGLPAHLLRTADLRSPQCRHPRLWPA